MDYAQTVGTLTTNTSGLAGTLLEGIAAFGIFVFIMAVGFFIAGILGKVLRAFFKEAKLEKMLRKEIEKLQALLAQQISDAEAGKAKAAGKNVVEITGAPYTQKLAEEVCSKLSAQGLAAVISITDGFIVAVAPKGSGMNAIELLKSHGGKGGGSEAFARGKVQ